MHDIVQTWTQKQTHVQPFLFHPWIERLKVSTKPFEGDLRKKNNKKTKNNYCVVYRKTNPNKSPTQTKLHSEQCPRPLMEAAQLVSKALHGPRELLPLHHLEALEDSSQKAVTCRQGNLQDYPEGWNQWIYINSAILHFRTEKYTGIHNCNVSIWSLCRPKISDTSIRHVFRVCVCTICIDATSLYCTGHGSCFPSHANEAMGFSRKGMWTHIPVPAILI